MLNPFVKQIVASFLVRQVRKWGAEIDWDLVKKDCDIRVRAIVPGEDFDDVAAFVVGVFIDLVAMAFQSSEVKTLDQAMTSASKGLERELGRRAFMGSRDAVQNR